MNQVLSEDQFAAFIGIDWADVKHDVCLQAADSNVLEFSILEHTPDEAYYADLPTLKMAA